MKCASVEVGYICYILLLFSSSFSFFSSPFLFFLSFYFFCAAVTGRLLTSDGAKFQQPHDNHLASSQPPHLSSGTPGAAELRESPAGGAALSGGVSHVSDRAAGAGKGRDAAAATAAAALGESRQATNQSTTQPPGPKLTSTPPRGVFQLRGQFDVIFHQLQNSNSSNDLNNQLTCCMEK